MGRLIWDTGRGVIGRSRDVVEMGGVCEGERERGKMGDEVFVPIRGSEL